jgi:hypothetical protein
MTTSLTDTFLTDTFWVIRLNYPLSFARAGRLPRDTRRSQAIGEFSWWRQPFDIHERYS